MANEGNLKPIKKGELSNEEAKKRGSKGGKRSAEVRRERKLIRDRILERMGEKDWDEMIDGLISRSKESVKDFEVLRDTVGEKPVEAMAIKHSGKASELSELMDSLKGSGKK